MRVTLLTLLMLSIGQTAVADKLYKWVDENGVTHYGDSVPARYSSHERHVLNEHGVTVDTLAREKTESELAAEVEAAAAAEQARYAAARQAEKDRVLLNTYLTVQDISSLRDRRVLAIEAQVGVVRQYLRNLQERWEELEAETRHYNFPYSESSDLPPLPDDLAQLIVHTERAMAEHLQTVQSLRREQEQIRADFAEDAERFKELQAQSQ
ncbi:MAG: DUF4124 domain-containing protein [Gammaproteobacteria bacterium]|nr:DUF4124 domain-containing protein [Gammaproteobacteria bacterium]